MINNMINSYLINKKSIKSKRKSIKIKNTINNLMNIILNNDKYLKNKIYLDNLDNLYNDDIDYESIIKNQQLTFQVVNNYLTLLATVDHEYGK